jgi:hypothetical protein
MIMARGRRTFFDSFNDLYESKISSDISRAESYELAADEYRKSHGFDAYSDNESFKSARAYRNRKNRKRRSES